MWKTTIKGLLTRKGRLVLTALSVAFGTAFIAGTLILTDSSTRALEGIRGYRPPADISVRGAMGAGGPNVNHVTGRARLPASLLETVREMDTVRAAEGSVFGRAVPLRSNGQPLTSGIGEGIVGVSWVDAPLVVPYAIVSGRPPNAADELVLASRIAHRHRYTVGDPLQVRFERSSARFTVVGVGRFRPADPVLGAVTVALPLKSAQRHFDATGSLDILHVDARTGVSPQDLRKNILAAGGRGVEVLTAEMVAAEDVQARRGEVRAVRDALLAFAAITLFVGAFIIFNTFSILVAQRSRELALLRALGASRRQVSAS
ncbi:MAG TPA: ABC transporter permease, partial [Actinomycetota bacterium]|nr:ABC transporter permease [Actinomycetota bacterium]